VLLVGEFKVLTFVFGTIGEMASKCYSGGKGVYAVRAHKRFVSAFRSKGDQSGHLLNPHVVAFLTILQQQQVYVFSTLGVFGDVDGDYTVSSVFIIGRFVRVHVNGEATVVAFKLANLGGGRRGR